MSIFSSIWHKITDHKAATPSSQTQMADAAPETISPTPQTPPASPQATSPAPQSAPGAAPTAPVDVEAILEALAAKKGGGGNWRTSIVDLLKLLELDASLDARKELATELGVNAGAPGTAEQNVALSKAVWKKLAENGGKVPDSLRN